MHIQPLARLLLVFGFSVMGMIGCRSDKNEGVQETVLLEWKDTQSGLSFQVTDHAILVDFVTSLRVLRNQNVVSVRQIADKNSSEEWLSVLTFVRTGDWLLVANGPYILAGYDYRTGQITVADDDDWTKLPFTFRNGSGQTVAERVVNPGASASPPKRWHLKEQATSTKSVE